MPASPVIKTSALSFHPLAVAPPQGCCASGTDAGSSAYLPATALLHVMMNGETGSAYNAASDSSDITLRELAFALAKFVGVNVIFKSPEKEEAMGYSKAVNACLNTKKLKMSGWKSRYDISGGLEKTIKIINECRLRV